MRGPVFQTSYRRQGHDEAQHRGGHVAGHDGSGAWDAAGAARAVLGQGGGAEEGGEDGGNEPVLKGHV